MNDPIALTIKRTCEISGLGRTKLYELIADGSLESLTVGTRRLITFESLQAFIRSTVQSTKKTRIVANEREQARKVKEKTL